MEETLPEEKERSWLSYKHLHRSLPGESEVLKIEARADKGGKSRGVIFIFL